MQDQFETVYCIHCKAPLRSGTQVCPRCGGSQRLGSPTPPSLLPPGAAAPPVRQKRWEKDRPTGVTIIAILMILNGLLGLMGACVLLGLAGLIGSMSQDPQLAQAMAETGGAVEFAAAWLVIVGVITIPLSLFNIVLAVGLLYMTPWARIVAIIVNFIGAGLVLVTVIAGEAGALDYIIMAIYFFVAIYLLTLGPEFSDYFD